MNLQGPAKSQTLLEFLDVISDNYKSEYTGILYPKFMISVYQLVLTNRWSSVSDINPEKFVDDNLLLWIESMPHPSLFLEMIKSAIQKEKRLFDQLCIRLNYALSLGPLDTVSDIRICRNRRGHLPFQNNLIKSGNDLIYSGSVDFASKIEKDELDKLADEFYSDSETVKQTKMGISERAAEIIRLYLINFGYEIINDRDILYAKINKMQREDPEASIIARVAYIIMMSSIDGNQTKRISL